MSTGIICACSCIERRRSFALSSRKARSRPMTHAVAVSTHAVERYLLEEMTELERHRFEEHYFDCQDCAADLRAGTLMREGVAAGMLGAGEPARMHGAATVAEFRPRRTWS